MARKKTISPLHKAVVRELNPGMINQKLPKDLLAQYEASYPSDDKARGLEAGGVHPYLAAAVEMILRAELVKERQMATKIKNDPIMKDGLNPLLVFQAEDRFARAALAAVRVGDSSFWKQVDYVRECYAKFLMTPVEDRTREHTAQAAASAFTWLKSLANQPPTARQVRDHLEEVTGINLTTDRVLEFLTQAGCKVRKQRTHSTRY